MNTKLKIAATLASIALVAAGCNQSSNSNNSAVITPTPTPTEQSANTSNPPVPIAAGQQHIVMYTDSGFSPKTLTIHQGDTVAFENTASDDTRVASNPHPIHNGYPTTGGCVGSTFDSCVNIPSGQMWLFTFDIVGNWGYHNHLNPSEGGTIVVQAPTSASSSSSPTPRTAIKKTAPSTGVSSTLPTTSPY